MDLIIVLCVFLYTDKKKIFFILIFQNESEVAAYMKKMLVGLGFPKPPDNITSFQLFSKLEAKVCCNP